MSVLVPEISESRPPVLDQVVDGAGPGGHDRLRASAFIRWTRRVSHAYPLPRSASRTNRSSACDRISTRRPILTVGRAPLRIRVRTFETLTASSLAAATTLKSIVCSLLIL